MSKPSSSRPLPDPVVHDRAGNAWSLYLTVLVSGAAVMILELLGTRIIGPFYGASLYVWSSLIAVTLIALALGYFVGGQLADRHPKVTLPWVILTAALTTAAIPALSGPILRATDPLGLRLGGFVSALLLFTAPLTALAMVGPYGIRRATRDLRGVGAAAGSVYAVSTLGSVAATVALGFFLLPRFGTRSIIHSLSAILAILALGLAWQERRRLPSAAMVAGAGLAVLLAARGFGVNPAPAEGFRIVTEAESTYGWVRVVDDERVGVRLLLSDASVLSAVNRGNGRTLLGYQAALGLVPAFRPKARTALLIGLGGGHVAGKLIARGLATDTIEIDPAVADAALQHFGFQPGGAFIVGDARYEIRRLAGRYDLIIHDCFTGGSEPTHLLSAEMLDDLRRRLAEGGVLALNLMGFRRGEGSAAVASVHATLASRFPHLRTFVTDQEELTDFIFVASDAPLNPGPAFRESGQQWLREHEIPRPEGQGRVITDDFNPLESLQLRKAEAYRRLFAERVALDLLVR